MSQQPQAKVNVDFGSLAFCLFILMCLVFGRAGCSNTKPNYIDHFLKAKYDYSVPGINFDAAAKKVELPNPVLSRPIGSCDECDCHCVNPGQLKNHPFE